MAPHGREVGITADALVHRADSAMYSGKRQGKGVAVHYRPEVTPDVRLAPDRATLAELRDTTAVVPEIPEVVAEIPQTRPRVGSARTPTQ